MSSSLLSYSPLDKMDQWPVKPPAGWRGLQLRGGFSDGAFAAERCREVTQLKQALRPCQGFPWKAILPFLDDRNCLFHTATKMVFHKGRPLRELIYIC